jgi:hypothetical protein
MGYSSVKPALLLVFLGFESGKIPRSIDAEKQKVCGK